MLKEEFSEIKLFLKPQPVQFHNTSAIGWFVKLHSEVYIDTYYKFFYNKVKLRVVKP